MTQPLIAILLLLGLSPAGHPETSGRPLTEAGCERFLAAHVARRAPLETQAAQAYWDGATQGTPEAFARRARLEREITALFQNRADADYLLALQGAGVVQTPLLRRQLERLVLAFRGQRYDPDLAARSADLDTRIQETYSTYRPRVEGRDLTMSAIYTALTAEGNTPRRRAIWRASKAVGGVIVEDLLRLVHLRNEAARQAGYANYYVMRVETGEQSVAWINGIVDDLERRTRAPFARLKTQLDATLAAGYGLDPGDLMPWHYHDPFFQRSPLVGDLDLDTLYRDQDVAALARRSYASVGLPVDTILARSDLYDRPGKYPHAFSHEIGRQGDVRILCNLQNTERWMETLLHELGHAVYSQDHDRSLPWLLREPAHAFTTEAVAMFFGRLSRNAAWLEAQLDLPAADRPRVEAACRRALRFQQILFARWAAVMVHFEQGLYAHPDQDLDALWWTLVERYQLLHRPPDPTRGGWASKLHFTSAPCYYHNYLLGELLASQFEHTLNTEAAPGHPSHTGDPRLGAFFRERVFGPAARDSWEVMIQQATGEALTPRYFVEQFLTP